MTERKHFKQRVRARMTKTGERYTSARDQVIRQAVPAEDLEPDYLKETTGMSNETVQAKTGKTWNGWLALLDAAGAREMKHAQIARMLHDKHGVPGWWAQTVTVGYERVRGLRALHEKADGFAVSKSKTFPVPLASLFRAWDDETVRRRWLDEELTVRKSTRGKSMRVTWGDGTDLQVYFYAKGDAKSQVSLQHGKLADGNDVKRLQAYWGEKLEGLKDLLRN